MLSSHSIASSDQNRQVMQSMGRLMDWTLEDNRVDGLFFCATLTGQSGGLTPFVQAGVETPATSMEAVKPDPGSFGEGHWGGWCWCRGWKCEPCGVVRLLRIPLVICPVRRTYVAVVRWTDELLCSGNNWMSRFEVLCINTRWALSGADVQAHGTAC